MIYFIADTHFGHKNVMQYCQRPFSSVEEMDNALIQNWNATVQPNDEIYILGDFSFGDTNKARSILARLNGIKYLVRGNHDKYIEQCKDEFVWIKDYAIIYFNKRKFVLFHYPIAEWDGYYRGAVHCYGHVHNHPIAQGTANNIIIPKALEQSNNSTTVAVNVGVDVNGFRPISIHEVISIADRKN